MRSLVFEFVIPSRVTRDRVDTQIPWTLMRSILSRLLQEKGRRVRVMGVASAMEHIFHETAMHARAQASNRLAKASRASHGPRVRVKERVKKALDNSKRKVQRNQKCEPRCQRLVQRLNIEIWSLRSEKNSKTETSSETQESAFLDS